MYYCYETKESFETLKEICKKFNINSFTSIRLCLNNPNKTAYGYHWCTDLSNFDNKDLLSGKGIYIYCYENKKRYKSYRSAAKSVGLKNCMYLIQTINNPNRTAGGYHWCTSLNVFDNVKLTAGGLSSNKSKAEYEILEFVRKYNLEVIHGSRKIISPYELDIYIPSLNLALEYNGKFWHDEKSMLKYKFKIPLSREAKFDLCKEKGIELIHIEEIDFKNSKNNIFIMLDKLIHEKYNGICAELLKWRD